MKAISEQRRIRSARLLLAVFLPMLWLSLTHVHQERAQEDLCVQCAEHQPHAGHLGASQVSLDECLLCQFITEPYAPAQVATLPIAATEVCRLAVLPCVPVTDVSLLHVYGRAPPAGSAKI